MRLIFTLFVCVTISSIAIAATTTTLQSSTNNGDGTATFVFLSDTNLGEDLFAQFRIDGTSFTGFSGPGTCVSFSAPNCTIEITLPIPAFTTSLEVEGIISNDGAVSNFQASSGFIDVTAALPVSLIKFTATPQNDRVAIRWETALELDNDYFTVERSADGKTFNAIAMVEGAGTTERSLSYSTFDNAPINGTSYYRLRQTDLDGTTVVFDAVSVELRTDAVVNAYPNPVKSELTVELTQAGPVRLYDLQGRLVLNRVLDAGRQELSLDALQAGTYVLQACGFHQTVIKQ